MALVAAAGPLSNLLLALIAGLMFRVIVGFHPPYFVLILLQMAVIINLMLAGFNLLPIPPLDGSRVVAYFLPPHLAARWHMLDRYGIFIILFLFLFAKPVLITIVFGFIRFFAQLFTGMTII
jgi:Zn-dependent protease